jgi:hypothetical protein
MTQKRVIRLLAASAFPALETGRASCRAWSRTQESARYADEHKVLEFLHCCKNGPSGAKDGQLRKIFQPVNLKTLWRPTKLIFKGFSSFKSLIGAI